ncbi:MAG: MATE family efflux transporter [Spirochaetaceae bacterium]|jgi:putative MATE family efflux protein|nr:MATE family efflux transporter [Spirochaetaceae bacterium]
MDKNKKVKNSLPPGNIMGTMSLNRLLLSMSIPMMISMMVQALYNIVDSIFVAQINENALTAVSLAFPVQALMFSVGIGTGVGINAFLSRSLGERNFDSVNKAATNGLFLVWLSSIAFMGIGFFGAELFFRSQTDSEEIVRYGRDYLSVVCIFSIAVFSQITFERLLASTGKTFYAMISQGIGAVANIILDPIMIFGLFGFPRMEVKGAAIATIFGQTLATLIALYFNLTKNHEVKLSFRGFRPDGRVIKSIYRVGLPSILMQSIGSVMTYGFNRILISFTATAAAVFGVYFRLQSFVFMPVFGLNNAMVPIIAFNYGAKQKTRIIKTIKLSLMYAVAIMVCGFILFELIPDKLLMMFNATAEMLSIGVTALRIIAIHFLLAGFCIVLISVFQALGDGLESLVVSFVRQLIVLLPAAWLLSRLGSVDMVWWSFPIAEVAALIISLILIKRMYDKKIKML